MSRAVLVDTSAFFALQNTGILREHAAIRRGAERLEAEGAVLVTTDYVLDETYTLLRTALGHGHAVRFGREVSRGGIDVAQIGPEIQREAWTIFEKYADRDFSFTDCTSFVVMRRAKIRLALTLDRHFRQFGFETSPALPLARR
jgi:predicted nucleic acid-binding protein